VIRFRDVQPFGRTAFRRCGIVALTCLFLGVVPLRAQLEPRAAQFVLVIDDSRSMDATDPNRLSVFAARALLEFLDDRDEASIVRLNDRENAPPIAPLGRNRGPLGQLLAPEGQLARYAGGNTTCRSALQEVRRLLDAAFRPNVPQVVLFLTDGRCTPEAERPDVNAFLSGLRSFREEGLFHFYLLRFPGEEPSPELIELVRRLGDEAIPVERNDPGRILFAFATAISHAQGYQAELLSPSSRQISAHRGAKRIRLLAMAPGGAPRLDLEIHDLEGRPVVTGSARSGSHQFPGRAAFRFTGLDYRRSAEPVSVRVTGASDWTVVALPEYDLSPRMTILRGDCETAGGGAGASIEALPTGESICLLVELVNEQGVVVGGDGLGRELEVFVRESEAGAPERPLRELPAEQTGDLARFRLQRVHMQDGDWIFQPAVRLRLPDRRASELRGPRKVLQVSTVTVATEPRSLDFGAVRPGETVTRPFTVTGSFRTTSARFELTERASVPACLSIELSGRREGQSLPITSGQAYTATLRVEGYCGPEAQRQAFTHRIRLAFESGKTENLPTIEIQSRWTLNDEIRVQPVILRLKAGEKKEMPIPIDGNRQAEAALKFVAADPEAIETWRGEHLVLSIANDEVERAEKPVVLPAAGTAPLRLLVRTSRCCAGGSYETRIRFVPDPAAYAKGGKPPRELLLPVRIDVDGAGMLACWGSRILAALLVATVLLALAYVVNMFRQSYFLSPDRVAEKLVPLSWTAGGGTIDQRSSGDAVAQMIRREIRWPSRVRAWLRANPLIFGLPGRSYRESLELFLQAQRDNSSVLLVPERDFASRLARDPESYRGRLFAIAQSQVSFVGIPDHGRRLSNLEFEGASQSTRRSGGEPEKAELERLQGLRLLRHPQKWERREGLAAGWRVG